MSDEAGQAAHDEPTGPDEILVVRRGPGANCSSVGSVLDVLFLSAVAGGAILVGIAAALEDARTRPARGAEEPPPGRRGAEEPDASEG